MNRGNGGFVDSGFGGNVGVDNFVSDGGNGLNGGFVGQGGIHGASNGGFIGGSNRMVQDIGPYNGAKLRGFTSVDPSINAGVAGPTITEGPARVAAVGSHDRMVGMGKGYTKHRTHITTVVRPVVRPVIRPVVRPVIQRVSTMVI